jgi:LacI family transcriptional regulator
VQLRRQARAAAAAGIRGVLLMPSRVSDDQMRRDEALLRACREVGLAVVLIERNLRGPGRRLEHDLAAADDVDGGLRCTEHLLDAGRRRVAFVAGSPTSSHEGRLAGYLVALQNSGGHQEPLVLGQRMALDTRAAYQDLADRLLRLEADGVVCYQDYTALGLIVELLARGLRVPTDVAITGFDNLPIGKAFALGVTTYAFPAEAIASQALRLVRWRARDPAGPPVRVLVRGELVIRESSAPA